MSEKSLRVLVLADSRAFHTERYVKELRAQDCTVLLASLESGTIEHRRLKDRGIFRMLHYVLAAKEIHDIIREFQPDVVNPHFASGYGFTAALAQSASKCPILLHLWGSDILIVPNKSAIHRRKTIFALKAASLVLADSEYLLRSAMQLHEHVKGHVIPWGLEEEHFALHKKSYEIGKPLRIIVPRKHESVYNNIFILRSLAGLINEEKVSITFPDFGTLTRQFKETARTMVGDKVRYYHKEPRSAFMRHMAEHDVYLSSAITDSSPASLIEAMGLGLIPVVANIPGVREWLQPGCGYAYEPYVSEGLRNTIEELISRGDPHEAMRKKNLERVRRSALFEQNVAETIQLMRSLSSGKDRV